jgi:hypothetical protein
MTESDVSQFVTNSLHRGLLDEIKSLNMLDNLGLF